MRIILLLGLAACADQRDVVLDHSSLDLPRGAGTDIAISVDGQPLTDLPAVAYCTVDDPSIVAANFTIDGAHLHVTGTLEGTTRVHISADSHFFDLPAHVSPPAIVMLWVEPATVATAIGDTVPVIATAIDTTDATRDVTATATWQIADPAIARLDVAAVQGKSVGDTTLQAMLEGVATTVPITVY